MKEFSWSLLWSLIIQNKKPKEIFRYMYLIFYLATKFSHFIHLPCQWILETFNFYWEYILILTEILCFHLWYCNQCFKFLLLIQNYYFQFGLMSHLHSDNTYKYKCTSAIHFIKILWKEIHRSLKNYQSTFLPLELPLIELVRGQVVFSDNHMIIVLVSGTNTIQHWLWSHLG